MGYQWRRYDREHQQATFPVDGTPSVGEVLDFGLPVAGLSRRTKDMR